MRPTILAAVFVFALHAQTPLQQSVTAAAQTTIDHFHLDPNQLAITVIDLNSHAHPQHADYHGAEPFYPASVVKLFYLVAADARIKSGQLQSTPEFQRALHDMIVSSSNDATQLVFSTLTDTTGGPELSPAELKPWLAKREVINQYFREQGYRDISVNQPTFAEDPYGRERQARGPNWENNNRVTTDAVARLWLSIVQNHGPGLDLLRRDPFAKDSADEQALFFAGKALPPGSQYYSKAGWTTGVRHDSAWITLPNGAQYILVAFTRGHSAQTEIVPFISSQIAAYFTAAQPSAHGQ